MDYLRPHGVIIAVSLAAGTKANECLLAERLATETYATVGHARFGASDCRCPGHLLYLPARPDFLVFDAASGTSTLLAHQLPQLG